MRKTFFTLAASTLLLGSVGSASAEMLTPLVAGPDDTAQVQLVRDGCGLGGHRGFYGRCRPNGGRFFRRGFYGRGHGFHRGHHFFR